MYQVYILKNCFSGELYYGYTADLGRRLKDHNAHDKWELVYYESYRSELDVRDREGKLKHYGQTRTHLKEKLKRSLAS